MQIQSTLRGSPMQEIAEDQSAGVVVGADEELPEDLRTDTYRDIGGRRLYTIAPMSQSSAFDNRLKLGELGLQAANTAFDAFDADLYQGADTALELSAVVLAGISLHSQIVEKDRNPLDIAIASTKQLGTLANLLSPLAPTIDWRRRSNGTSHSSECARSR